jgi:hypothetical protein
MQSNFSPKRSHDQLVQQRQQDWRSATPLVDSIQKFVYSTAVSCLRYPVSFRDMVFQLFQQFSKHSHRVLRVSQSSDGGQRYPADYPVVAAFSVLVKNYSMSSLLDEDFDC